MKSNYNKYLIDDESSLDNELLFDDWNVRDSSFYSRERKTYILLFLLFSVCTIFAAIVSIFYIYVLFFLVLFSVSLFCILFQFLRIQNRHIQIYKDVIVVTNIFRKKRIINYCFDKTSLLIKHTFQSMPKGIHMVFIEDGKIICKYNDFINYASSYQEQKTNWEISIMAIGLKIIDPQEIFKN